MLTIKLTFLQAFILLCGASRKVSPSICTRSHLQADCKNHHLTAPPTDLPANITTLFLDENQIKSLNADAFAGTKQLLRLTITNCGLSKVNDSAFTGLSKLTELRLNNNALTAISNKLFGPDLAKLKMLFLNYNRISRISQDALDHLKSLQELHLDHNRLTSLHPHAFNKLTSIKSISLEFNSLTTARMQWFYPVNSTLNHISLHNNSWVCDCQMAGYKTWTASAHKKFGSSVDIICSDKNTTLKNIHGKALCQLSSQTLSVALESTITILCPEESWKSWSFSPRAKNKSMHEVSPSDERKILDTGLTVIGASRADAGIYCCASKSATDLFTNKHCTTLKVYTSTTDHSGQNSSAAVVVIVILLSAACVCCMVWYFKRKRRNYGILNDETVFQPTIDDYQESSHITPRNTTSSTTDEAYV